MNAPCLDAEVQRRKKRVQMLRHQDTAQRLEDHKGEKQCVDHCPEYPVRAVSPLEQGSRPLSVQHVMDDEKDKDQRPDDLMKRLADQ